jgi:RecB family exonuclease
MDEEEKNNTLLLLADENLVSPLSHELDISQINITMGKPLKETAVATFIQSCFQLVQNSARFNKYYHRDLLAWLHNPFFQLYCPQAEELIQKMNNNNRVFYSFNEICVFLGEWKIIHEKWNIDGMIFLENVLENFQRILKKISIQHPFQEPLTLIIPILENFVQFFKKLPQDKIDLKTLHYFMNEKLNAIRIPYQYNEEKGLQVMGLLETRCLDFKNIIVLSLNEGILPDGKENNSLLLHEIKKYFKLPLAENKVMVYAAHFFRLLQRAENIYLIYDTDSSENLAEKSRFIRQLEFEIKAQNLENSLIYSESSLDFQQQKWQSAQPIVYNKTTEVIIKLLEHSYSTSSLNTYILCPLKFYLQHIEKIEKPKTVTETVEQKVIGTIIHDILRDIFLKIKEKPSDFQYIIENQKKNLDKTVLEAFSKNEDLKGQDPTQGRLFLYTEIVKKNLDTYIDEAHKEMQQSAIEILSVEELLQGNLSVNQKDIHLKGFADRIDKRQNILTILDYKTGKIDEKELKINDVEELFQDPNKGKLFQLFFYGLLYKQKLKQKNPPYFNAGIISFQNLHKNGKSLLLPDIEKFNKLLPDFEKRLEMLIQEIINSKIPFTQTEDPSRCKYCDYQDLCGIQTEHFSF